MELWHLKNVFLPKRTASKYRLLALRSAQAICIYFFFSCPHAAVQNRDTMTAFAHAVMRPCLQDCNTGEGQNIFLSKISHRVISYYATNNYKAAPMPMPSCLTHPFHTGEGQNIFLSKKKVQISVLQCKTKTNIVGQWLIKKLLVLSFRRYQVSTRNLNTI